jgi:hypothetical protein
MKASNESLEDVYKKWEKKGEERRLNGPGLNTSTAPCNEDLQPGRTAWQQRFDASALPSRRPIRKKHRATREIVRIMNEIIHY